MTELLLFWIMLNVLFSCTIGRFMELKIHHLMLRESPLCTLPDVDDLSNDFSIGDYLYLPQQQYPFNDGIMKTKTLSNRIVKRNILQQQHHPQLFNNNKPVVPSLQKTRYEPQPSRPSSSLLSSQPYSSLSQFDSCHFNLRLSFIHSSMNWQHNFSIQTSFFYKSNMPSSSTVLYGNGGGSDHPEFIVYNLPVQRFQVIVAELSLQNISIWLEVWDAEFTKLLLTLHSTELTSLIEFLPKNFTMTEFGNSVQMELAIVPCANGLVDTNCDILCQPPTLRDHYDCLPNQKKKCHSGWSEPNCTKPTCSISCGPGGVCVAPEKCACKEGWRGADCSQCIPRPGCVNGDCKKPNECICHRGWTKWNCDERIDFCTLVQPCKNGGKCTTNNTYDGEYMCICLPGFGGYNCAQKLPLSPQLTLVHSPPPQPLPSVPAGSLLTEPSTLSTFKANRIQSDNEGLYSSRSINQVELMVFICVALLALILYYIVRFSPPADNYFDSSLQCSYREPSQIIFKR